jgi:hypothetical protein
MLEINPLEGEKLQEWGLRTRKWKGLRRTGGNNVVRTGKAAKENTIQSQGQGIPKQCEIAGNYAE